MLSKSTVKYIQNLSRKKFRDEERVFVAEGPKIVEELIGEIPGRLQQLFATAGWLESKAKQLAGLNQEMINTVSDDELERISSLKTAHDVLAIFKQPADNTDYDPTGKISLVLDGIQDPGNLGTIIRIADWFAIEAIICSEDCADCYNAKVVQSTMASIARVKILYGDPVSWISNNKTIRVYGTVMNGRNIYETGNITEGIIVIGNESKGIRPELMKLLDEKISIPRKGSAESLNAAVATGIVLSHISH